MAKANARTFTHEGRTLVSCTRAAALIAQDMLWWSWVKQPEEDIVFFYFTSDLFPQGTLYLVEEEHLHAVEAAAALLDPPKIETEASRGRASPVTRKINL